MLKQLSLYAISNSHQRVWPINVFENATFLHPLMSFSTSLIINNLLRVETLQKRRGYV